MVKQFVLCANGSYWSDFLKIVLWSHPTEGAMTSSFVEQPIHNLLSPKDQRKWNF